MRPTSQLAAPLLLIVAATGLAHAVPTGDATATLGADECRAGLTQPQCRARPFVRASDIAWSGNGSARPAVAKDTIAGAAIHKQANLNDGFYGNGASWISASADAWVKIDLGRAMKIDGIRLGRDRTGAYKDRGTGGFIVSLAASDAVYAAGNDASDATEYTKVFEATATEVANAPAGATFVASFTPTVARYVKVQVRTAGAALDEIEVSGVPVEADACAVNACGANMVCTDLPGADLSAAGRTCGCTTGYAAGAGGVCVDVDECAAKTDGCLEGCANTVGSFVCTPDDAWTVSGEAGFPRPAGAAFVTVSAVTTLAVVRVPSSYLSGPARISVTTVVSGSGLLVAVGATVAPDPGPTTELPLPYTLVPGRTYQLSIKSGAEQLIVGAQVPLAETAFAVVPDQITLQPAPRTPGSASRSAAARSYGVRLARSMILTGVASPTPVTMPPRAAKVTDRTTGAVIDEASGLRTIALAAPLDAGRSYLVAVTGSSPTDALMETMVLTAAGCTGRTSPGTANLVTYDEAACAGVGGASTVWVSPEPVVLQFTRLALAPPLVPTTTRTVGAGGPTARAYQIKATERTSISAVGWTVGAASSESLEARIWDDRGVLLARGLPVPGTGAVATLYSPLTFTFEAGRTYLVGFSNPTGSMELPLKELGPDAFGVMPGDQTPYSFGGLTVTGVRSSPSYERNASPTAANTLAPLFELMLTPGACAEGTCRRAL